MKRLSHQNSFVRSSILTDLGLTVSLFSLNIIQNVFRFFVAQCLSLGENLKLTLVQWQIYFKNIKDL